MPFTDVDPTLDLRALEERVLVRWRENDLEDSVATLRADGVPWIFYEGPPTANGEPGLHHVWARVFKDLFPRFQTMKGRRVPRKGGWDCHGLPVELEVERELGLETKYDIEEYGVAEFNERCRASVQRYVENWSSLTARAGVWIDTRDAYWTLSNDYIESVWWLVKRIWDEGLLYEGHRVSPYCARCGTALSSHEVAQGYEDVVDRSVYVRFPVTARAGAEPTDLDLLVWTTTPWTLVSNVAVAVSESVEYLRISIEDDRDLVMTAAAAESLFPEAQVAERLRGGDLVGWEYERPFDFLEIPEGKGQRVVAADFVSTDEGSGLVHLAPAFGEDDYQMGEAEGLVMLNPVDADGTFDDRIGPWAGRFVKDADAGIIDELSSAKLLVREQPYEHSYPHCWRCGTPLIYWATTSWFARTSARRENLLRENQKIGWHPAHLKDGRFGKWLEGNVDWALSRERFWGTPLPVWRCGVGHDTCIGSLEELSTLAGSDLTGLDLHRPFVDEVTFRCPADGCDAVAHRLPPVLDAWFDSGSMPTAQHHFPFDRADDLDSLYPADFICEAIDQTRGWFYSLLAVNTLVFDATPYRNVVCLGHIVDETGAKMSKSRGNVIDPWTVFGDFGADALRWYFFSSGQPWSPRRVFEEGIRESTRHTLLTLWNVYSFFVTYANIDGWSVGDSEADDATHALDRWIQGELDDAVSSVGAALEEFDALGGATRLARFVDDLSNWYVRRSRPRFWKSSDPAAHATLHRCLVVAAQLLAPYCPFLADEIYTTLTGEESVHLSDWPIPDAERDEELAGRMESARRLVSLGRAARTEAKVRIRQPLSRALLLHPGAELDAEAHAEVAEELNVKALEEIDTLSGLMGWTVMPNFRLLGPRLGPKVNEVKAALAEADGSALRQQLESEGRIVVAGETLVADEVELRADRHEAFALAEDGGWAVALDLELDDDLRLEGLARELVRAINDLRKEEGLEIADRVRLTVGGDDGLAEAVEAHRMWIMEETLAVELVLTSGGDHRIELDEREVAVGLEVA